MIFKLNFENIPDRKATNLEEWKRQNLNPLYIGAYGSINEYRGNSIEEGKNIEEVKTLFDL